MDSYKAKYLKYKNKYLTVKNQSGGSEEEFPALVLNNYTIPDPSTGKKCFTRWNLNIGDNVWATLKLFFCLVINNQKHNFYPDTPINETNFIGKTNFTKDDLQKIWYRLSKSITDNSNVNLIGVFYQDTNTNFVPLDDFINIQNDKITINQIDYNYTGVDDKYNVLYQVSQKIIGNNRSSVPFDPIQSSGTNDPFSWEIYNGNKQNFEIFLTTVFGSSSVSNTFNDNKEKIINYKHCGNFVIFYKESGTFTEFLICYVQPNGQNLNLFPFGFKNLLVNNTFETPVVALFNSIKTKIEEIYSQNINLVDKVYKFLIKEYMNNTEYDDFKALFTDNMMDLNLGVGARVGILKYFSEWLYIEGFDLNELQQKPGFTTLEEETLRIFNEFAESAERTREPYYKILPDGFFHIHVVNASEKYMLLTCHVDVEIPVKQGNNINYQYTDRNGATHKQTRRKLPNPKNLSLTFEARKRHNFYVLFNMKSNKHLIYGLDSLKNDCSDSIFFSSQENIGIAEELFNDNICDINHIDNYGIIVTKGKKPCQYYCKHTNDISKIKFDNIYAHSEIYNDKMFRNEQIYLTDGKMKCASGTLINNNKTLLIDDILVDWKFKNCDKTIIRPDKMINQFVNFAKTNNLDSVELDDDAFLQIPTKFYAANESKFKYSLLYLYKTPTKPSIYSSKFGLNNKHLSKKWYEKLNEFLECEVNKYKYTNTEYDLFIEANRLLRKISEITPDISDDVEFKKFETKYKDFDDNIKTKLNEFMKNNIDMFIMDPDICGQMSNYSNNTREEVKEELTKPRIFSDFTKIIGIDKFIINKIDFDKFLP